MHQSIRVRRGVPDSRNTHAQRARSLPGHRCGQRLQDPHLRRKLLFTLGMLVPSRFIGRTPLNHAADGWELDRPRRVPSRRDVAVAILEVGNCLLYVAAHEPKSPHVAVERSCEAAKPRTSADRREVGAALGFATWIR
jgi:hypothetical protein